MSNTLDPLINRSRALKNILGLAAGIATFLGTPSSANLAAALTDETGSGSAVFGNTPTLVTPNITTSATITRNALGITSQAGSTLQNLTAAVNGAQQYSPMAIQTAQGFDTIAVGSKPIDFCSQVEPNQTAGNPTGNLRWYVRQNNGTWVSAALLSSSGTISAAASLIAGAGVTAAADIATTAGALVATRTGIGVTTVDGLKLTETTVSSVGTPVQYAPTIHFTGHVLNTTGNTDETSELTLQFQPLSSVSPTSQWVFLRNRNGAGNVVTHTFFDNGALAVTGQLSTTAAIVAATGITSSTGNIQASAGQLVSVQNAIGTTLTVSLNAQNSTLSTVGTPVQQSPANYWRSSGFNSTAAVAEQHDWVAYVVPATAAGPTTSVWKLQAQISGGGYSDRMTLTNVGGVTFTGSMLVQGTTGITASGANAIINASNGSFLAQRNAIGTGFSTGYQAANVTPALVGTPNQWSPNFRATGSVYDGTTSQSLNWRHELQTAASGSAAARGDYVFLYSNSSISAGAWVEYIRMFGSGGLFVANRSVVPGTPTGGGSLYVEAGALKYIGSSGTITTLAAA